MAFVALSSAATSLFSIWFLRQCHHNWKQQIFFRDHFTADSAAERRRFLLVRLREHGWIFPHGESRCLRICRWKIQLHRNQWHNPRNRFDIFTNIYHCCLLYQFIILVNWCLHFVLWVNYVSGNLRSESVGHQRLFNLSHFDRHVLPRHRSQFKTSTNCQRLLQ